MFFYIIYSIKIFSNPKITEMLVINAVNKIIIFKNKQIKIFHKYQIIFNKLKLKVILIIM